MKTKISEKVLGWGIVIAIATSRISCSTGVSSEENSSIKIDGSSIVSQVGYVPLPEDGYQLTKIHFQRGKVGTVFGGRSAFNLTIGELLRKQAKF